MNVEYGIINFWTNGTFISHFTALILLVMSILSWTQIINKSYHFWQQKKIWRALENFWQAENLDVGVRKLTEDLGEKSFFVYLATKAINGVRHFEQHKTTSIGDNLDKNKFITHNLKQSINYSTAKLESGLTMLASIGAVSPFVGLFGTVYGIYNALLGISVRGEATLNKVSGPVGEALIMTAAGLFVAIPAVLSYNAFVRMNRLELMELDSFAGDLQSYFHSGVKISTNTK